MSLQQFRGIANQLRDELADARDRMDAVATAAPTQRGDLLKNAGICLDRAARTLNDLRAAQQGLSSADSAQGRRMADGLSNDLKKARQELATLTSRVKSADLMGAAGTGNEIELEMMQMDQRSRALKNMAAVDQQNLLVANGMGMLNETEQMTNASLMGLRKQKDVLNNVSDNIHHINSAILEGDAVLVRMKRRQQRSFIIFIAVIVVLLAVDIFVPVFVQVG